MKNITPKEITLYVSIAIAGFAWIMLLLSGMALGQFLSWYISLFIAFLIFIFNYAVIFTVLNNFVYRKIKLIYKIIYDIKSPKSKQGSVKLQENVLADTEQEVLNWARSRKQEIEQLKKLEKYRREFLANVSHELKTPIFNIQGYIETLIDGGIHDEQVNMDYLHKANNNIHRLEEIIDDLQVISSIEDGNFSLEKVRFDIHQLTRDVFKLFEMEADSYDITLGFKEGCNKSFFIYADPKRIRQVLENLVSNAIKYGKEKGNILAGFYDMDEYLLVEISDDGIGIAKRHLPRLFERFFRVDQNRSRRHGGTGLGLSIVKHIIEAHGQTIHVRSTPGVGSTFGFTLSKTIEEKKSISD